MSTSAKLGIPFVAESQAQANVAHNEAVQALQVLATGVMDILDTPPGSPVDGDAYLIGTAPTGVWASRANHIAYYLAGWRYIPGEDSDGAPIAMGSAQEGMRIWVADENQQYIWTESAASPSTLAWRAMGVGPFLPLAGGTLTGSITIQRANGSGSNLTIVGDGAAATFNLQRHSADSNASNLLFQKSRGPAATSSPPAVVTNATGLGAITWQGWDGVNAFRTACQISSRISDTTPAGPTAMGGQIQFFCTLAGTITITEVFRLDATNGFQMGAGNQVIDIDRLFRLRVYTVATLPTGIQGKMCYASDLRVFNGAGTQEGAGAGTGGTVVHNGTAWKIAGTNVTAVA